MGHTRACSPALVAGGGNGDRVMTMDRFRPGLVVRVERDGLPEYGVVVASDRESVEVELLSGSRECFGLDAVDALLAMPDEGFIAAFIRHEKREGAFTRTASAELARMVLLDLGGRASRQVAGLHLGVVLTGQLAKTTRLRLNVGLEDLARRGLATQDGGHYVLRSAVMATDDPVSDGEVQDTRKASRADADGSDEDPVSPGVSSGRARPDAGRRIEEPSGREMAVEDVPAAGHPAAASRAIREVAREASSLHRRMPALRLELTKLHATSQEIGALPDEDVAAALGLVADDAKARDIACRLAREFLRRPKLVASDADGLGAALRRVHAEGGTQVLAEAVADVIVAEPARARSIWRVVVRHLSTMTEAPSREIAAEVIARIVCSSSQLEKGSREFVGWASAAVGAVAGEEPARLSALLARFPPEAPRAMARAILGGAVAALGRPAVLSALRMAGDSHLPLYRWLAGETPRTEIDQHLRGELLQALAHSQPSHAAYLVGRLLGAVEPLSAIGLIQTFALVFGREPTLTDEQRADLVAQVVGSALAPSADDPGLFCASIAAAREQGKDAMRTDLESEIAASQRERDESAAMLRAAQGEVAQLRDASALLQDRLDDLHGRDAETVYREVTRMAVEMLDLLDGVVCVGRVDEAVLRARGELLRLLEQEGMRSDSHPGEEPSQAWVAQGLYRALGRRGEPGRLQVTRRAIACMTPDGGLRQVREGWLEVVRDASC